MRSSASTFPKQSQHQRSEAELPVGRGRKLHGNSYCQTRSMPAFVSGNTGWTQLQAARSLDGSSRAAVALCVRNSSVFEGDDQVHEMHRSRSIGTHRALRCLFGAR